MAQKRRPGKQPTWRVGDAVWYLPVSGGPLFRARVASEPWLLGDHTWVVNLEGLPDAYVRYTSRDRRSVPCAEATRHVIARAAGDDREMVDGAHAIRAIA